MRFDRRRSFWLQKRIVEPSLSGRTSPSVAKTRGSRVWQFIFTYFLMLYSWLFIFLLWILHMTSSEDTFMVSNDWRYNRSMKTDCSIFSIAHARALRSLYQENIDGLKGIIRANFALLTGKMQLSGFTMELGYLYWSGAHFILTRFINQRRNFPFSTVKDSSAYNLMLFFDRRAARENSLVQNAYVLVCFRIRKGVRDIGEFVC